MKDLGGRVRSARVARRLFGLFVLSAFVPLALVALLSWSQVRSMLLQQGDQRLAAHAKTYGMAVFERLFIATDIGLTAALAAPTPVTEDSLAARTFATLGTAEGGRLTGALHGQPVVPKLDAQAERRLADGKHVVLLTPGRTPAGVVLVSSLAQGSRAVVFGELRPEYLWGAADELPAQTDMCVVEEGSRQLLHCSGPTDLATMPLGTQRGASTLGAAKWIRDEGMYRSRAWPQFMRAGFGAPDWIVVAGQPESVQLAAARRFAQLFLPTVVLAVLLVTWLTIRQSRHIVGPIERLAERARAIAGNDFAGRLALARDDEFGELANAFDQMSERLGRQFASLTALAEIDRLILSTQDSAEVIRTVILRLDEMVPSDLVAITLFDHDNPEHARTYWRPVDAPDTVSMTRLHVPPAQRAAMQGLTEARWIVLDGLPPGEMQELRAQGMQRAYVQPIVWRGALCGVLALGYRQDGVTSDDERRRTQEMADRVAVAVSSAWRDEQLYVQAHFDPLTGLPNRLLFKDRLGREIIRSQREGRSFAVLFVDLDRFKTVNDSFGHSVGDAVLEESARRISRAVRESDTVARLGGDEFTVLLTSLNHAQEAWLIAETIVSQLSQQFSLGDNHCFLSASVGIASYPADGQTVEELLKSADTAMYRAKAGGRSQVVFFEERMNAETVARLTLDRDLRAAVERGELVLHFQPQMELATGEIRMAEALVRWNHPVHGLVSPARFIPLAEESGYIEQLGDWILEQACVQVGAWRAQGLAVDRISVNVSPRQFRRRTLVDDVRRSVERAGVDASCLELEITEGLLVDRGEAVEGMLHELAGMGHAIALDDFGTGFSSMAYLKRFPVSTIKIDRVFVEGLDKDAPDSEAIVAAIIAMSHALGKKVVAEGVETAEQMAILRRLECDVVQGYVVSRAIPPEDFARLLRSRRGLRELAPA